MREVRREARQAVIIARRICFPDADESRSFVASLLRMTVLTRPPTPPASVPAIVHNVWNMCGSSRSNAVTLFGKISGLREFVRVHTLAPRSMLRSWHRVQCFDGTLLKQLCVGGSEEHTSELQSPYVISYAV